jgi:hypothetical protein
MAAMWHKEEGGVNEQPCPLMLVAVLVRKHRYRSATQIGTTGHPSVDVAQIARVYSVPKTPLQGGSF